MTKILHAASALIIPPLHELTHPGRGQIASLDFLRSCAILLVLGFHYNTTYLESGGHDNPLVRFPLFRYGWMGVDLFFVLSGYFIGKQLWRELARTGTLDFRRFIVRRGLRIWPLYYAVFLFVAFGLGRGDYAPEAWWADIVFLSNYFDEANVIAGGWSLSIEEQFYLIAPILLLATLPLMAGLPAYRGWLLGLFVLLPLIRGIVAWNLTGDFTTPIDGHDWKLYIYSPIHTRADGLIMGLFLAHLEAVDGDRYKHGIWTIVPMLAAACLYLTIRTSLRGILNYTCHALLFGSITWFLLARRRRWLAILDSHAFFVVSRLSFGMYLNHFYLLEPMARFGEDYLPLGSSMPLVHYLMSFALFAMSSMTVAILTFVLIESPFLRLRDWIYAEGSAVKASASRATG